MTVPSTFFFALINFALFVTVLALLLRKPLARYFAARSEAIAKAVADAAAAEAAAQSRAHEIQGRLARIEEEITALQQQAREMGEQEQRDIIARAHEFAEKSAQDTDRLVEQELRKVKKVLRGRTVDLAILMAERLLREQMTPDDQGRLAQQFVRQLGSLH
ncbi:MAG: ATP synthase F0 subunit B [Deltaproteobacteria bacterium]|nr:ATP synthase F0 subunit B [Deltaproteobacteria bacterium]